MPNLHCSTCQLKSIQVLHCLLCVLSLIVCDETVTLGPICLCVLHQLDAVDATKRLKDPPQHVLGDVEVEAANVKLHGSLFRPCEAVSISSNPVLLCSPALLRLAGLNNHRHPAQLLPRETEGQRHRLQVLELNIGDSFEPPRLVAHNQLHIANFAHRGEEILDIPGPHPLTELHAEDGPSVPLLGSKRLFGARRSDIPDVKLAVDISHPAGRTLGGSALLPVSASSASWTSQSRLNPPVSAPVSPVSASTPPPAPTIFAAPTPPPPVTAPTPSFPLTTSTLPPAATILPAAGSPTSLVPASFPLARSGPLFLILNWAPTPAPFPILVPIIVAPWRLFFVWSLQHRVDVKT